MSVWLIGLPALVAAALLVVRLLRGRRAIALLLGLNAVLLGNDLELVYRVLGAGCGVTALQLDGRPLAFVEEANPYRRGAARVLLDDLTAAREGARRRQLVVSVGQE